MVGVVAVAEATGVDATTQSTTGPAMATKAAAAAAGMTADHREVEVVEATAEIATTMVHPTAVEDTTLHLLGGCPLPLAPPASGPEFRLRLRPHTTVTVVGTGATPRATATVEATVLHHRRLTVVDSLTAAATAAATAVVEAIRVRDTTSPRRRVVMTASTEEVAMAVVVVVVVAGAGADTAMIGATTGGIAAKELREDQSSNQNSVAVGVEQERPCSLEQQVARYGVLTALDYDVATASSRVQK